MRLIDADALVTDYYDDYEMKDDEYSYPYVSKAQIDSAPSIDIVRCKECMWLRYCETEDMNMFLDCDHPDGGGIPRSEEWFCADGERRE